ncbi:MAG TPA: GPR1/FUN34/YaaH family transporter [Candidatus Binataceae bacterium]|nr:GPR1/FUN34/YaaH family transporter [Candidatus Binataceae bacterium]
MADVTSINEGDGAIEHATWTKAGPVPSRMPVDEIAGLEEHAIATIGDSSTLGMWAFATGTWMAAAIFGGELPYSSAFAVIPVLLIFAGIAQFIAGLYSFRRANSLLATAFTCFGSFNTTFGLVLLLESIGVIPMTASTWVFHGFLLESFAFIALALCFAAFQANMATVAMTLLLGAGYCLAGIPYFAGKIDVGAWGLAGNIGGYLLMASAFCAYYIGMAMVVNSTWKREVLPLFGHP